MPANGVDKYRNYEYETNIKTGTPMQSHRVYNCLIVHHEIYNL